MGEVTHLWFRCLAGELRVPWAAFRRRPRPVEGEAAEFTMVLACQRNVFCDTLRGTIEAVYDRAIREHNQGFIPLD